MMTCRTASSLHTAAEEGAVSVPKLLRYRVHMTVCGPCRRYRAQLATVRALLKHLSSEVTPPAPTVDLLSDALFGSDHDR